MKTLLLPLTLLTYLSCIGQTGPGGVGTSATNVFWLKADAGAYNDAGVTLATNTQTVQQWNDRSGNGKNFSEIGVGQQPTLRTGVINAMPVLRFDGNNDRLSNLSITSGSNATFYAVVNYSSLPNPNPGIFQGSPAGLLLSTTGSDKVVGMWVSNVNRPWGRGTQTNSTQCNITQVYTTAAGSSYIIESTYNGTNIVQTVNGNASGSVAYNGTLKSWTEFAIGRQGSETWAGDIAEVIGYNTNLNSAQRIIVQNYLAAKYGLSLLAANDVYAMDNASNGDYDFDVAGIGRVDASNIHNAAQGSGIVSINSPNNLGDGEYLIFGHNNASSSANETTDVPFGVLNRMNRKWRASEVGEVGTINISVDLTGLGSVTVSDLRLMIDTDNDGSFTDETAISGATSLGSNVYQWAGIDIDNNNAFSFGTVNPLQTPMPVELVEFYALSESGKVDLHWETATEINCDHFDIERSVDGFTFEKVGSVATKAINGNSNGTLNYYFNDEKPAEGNSYYRLHQFDKNGKSEYSSIASVFIEQSQEVKFVVYPNPNIGEFSVDFSGIENDHEVLLEMYDMNGRKVYENSFMSESKATNTIHILPTEKMHAGQYIVNFIFEGIKYPVKVIVN